MINLIKKLAREKISLTVEGNDLKLRFGNGNDTLAPELIKEIRDNKQALIAYLNKYDQRSEYAVIRQVEEMEDYPVSDGQRRMWVLHQINAASLAYHLSGEIVLEGTYSFPWFEKAVKTCIERHEILRTIFRENAKGDLRQVVLPAAASLFRFDYKDLEEATAEEVADYIRQDANAPFDLAKGPLLRAGLVRLAADRYIFHYTMHHIISDGWSMELLSGEILALYTAYAKGTTPALSPLLVQYKDFAGSQLLQVESGALNRHREYWQQQLSGTLPSLELPIAETRPVVFTDNGYYLSTRIDPSLVDGLQRLCQQQNCSLFMGLISVLNVLFYRYTGQGGAIIGTPVAGRKQAELENQIGFYLNTVALRTQFNGDESFLSLLQHVREITLGAFDHQSYPFDRLVDDLRLKRDTSRSALFDVMVVLQNQQQGETSANLRKMGEDGITEEGAVAVKLDLLFNFAEIANGMYLRVEFNSDIYDRSAITGLINHYKQLLRLLVEAPGIPVYAHNYLQEKEQQLLHTFNDTDVDYERGVTLPGLFRRQVALQPEATALVFKDSHFTYRELDEISGRLASYLHTHYTLAPEDLIGIKLHRSEWLIISLLAVLKAGCAYVPVDPLYPEERQRYIAEDSGYKACIDDALLETFREGIYSPDCYHEVGEDQLAYVLYTSGSSGVPKGCMLEHKGLINRLRWMWDHYGFTTADVVLQKTTFTFDVSVWELFIPLCFGCRMILSSDETVYSPAQLSDLIRRHKVSRAHFVPVMLSRFIEEVDIASLDSLQHVFASGEALPAATVKAWYKRTAVPLSNLYGPTEASIEVSYYDTNPESDKVAIGKPIANTHLHILDQYSQQVPVGIAGEIHIGGIQLARGYHHRPDLTAEKFIDHAVLKERLYRTGDLGRWLSDGNIEYLGRIDDQVKVRGYRIEPGEVEHALKGLPGIAAAVVTAYKQSSGEQALAAYYLSDVAQDAVLLRQQLLQQLPEYMVPGYFTQLAALPLTPSGKVDRKALPAPEGGVSAVYVAPRNATEAQLVVIWQEVLRTDTSFSITDDFFVSGGHSLKVMQLINHYARHFEVKVSVQDLFHHTTISAHASLLSTQGKTAYSDIQPVAPASDYAVSDGQRRLWVLSQLEDSSRAYHLSGQMEVEEMFRSSHLEAAINRVIGRHEILRTVFREGAGSGLRQVVLEPSAAVFKLDDAALENESQVPAYIAGYSGKVFDLGSFPLLRAGLIRLSSGRCIFHYTMHHIISDGWSMELLREEVLAYYNSYVKNEELSLSPLRIQYKDFTAWQQQQAYGVHKDYWETQFGGELPVLELPGSRVRPAVKTYNGYMLSTGISPALTQGLQALCQQQQSTLFMGLLGVLNALFYRYTGQEDIIIGSPVAGREHAELEGQIGFYLNTVALRSRFSGGDNFLSLLSHIRSTTLAAYDHQSYPFDRLVDDLKLKRDTSRSSLFDVFLNVLNIDTATAAATVLPSGQVSQLGPSPSKFDLIFNFQETAAGGLSVYAEFNSDIYDQWFVIRLLEHYQRLLSAVITQPATALNQLDYLGEEEREQLLHEFNATTKDYGNDGTVLDLFRESVVRYGDRTAITDGAATLSYRLLDEQSDQVAARLQQHYAIREGDLVGMRIPRSTRAITLMLGILKAGAGYVPVDMSNPEERTAFIVADSGCRLLVDEKILEDIYAGLTEQPSPSAVMSAESIAYVLYTSGTTGHPKGVLIAHNNLYNY
ncbi:amino acid adenylation domain-containing protein, partial [Chitinophaga ginsengisegetis]|uniref:non-ribosomal peptide synthetase n=3 Tax=Chitinophaga TaxID=79328 RepID=UPI002864E6BB